MALSNYLNRNITDDLHPTYEIMYCAETLLVIAKCMIFLVQLVFIAFTQLLGWTIIYVMFRTTFFRRHIRMRIIFGVFGACIHTFTRIFVIYFQYFGLPGEGKK
ncbi:hypothetical protein PFISCL1PPCAC_27937 [Pristionchus fissidentatus]|uniref:G protein-coupled receptor n=1 Tax=Pristionchus fissidentatus TaxID=1538716 RepID=A0AAV5X151_9BILA|nr:hypothetical protein PFISCL1PPCAC_27937 [Pristionchus fissidentatus]